MSQSAVARLEPLDFEIVVSDGEPLESYWHVIEISLLDDVVRQMMAERGRADFFCGGNMFVYGTVEEARNVARGGRYFRGPDFFYVGGVPPRNGRKAWISWEEGGRMPDLIIELVSPSTAEVDRVTKKVVYGRDFRTPEYFLYQFETRKLEGFRLAGGSYRPIQADSRGRLWSEQLGLALGLQHGIQRGQETDWLRFFYPDGRMAPTKDESERQRADAADQRADAERQRADAAEAELARLRAELARLGKPGA